MVDKIEVTKGLPLRQTMEGMLEHVSTKKKCL